MMQLCKFFSISPSTAYMLNYLFLCFHRSTKLKSTSTELVDFFSTCLWTWLKILLQICILVNSISTTIWFKLFPQTSVSNWQLGFLKIIFTNKTSILENWATLLWNLYNYSFATCNNLLINNLLIVVWIIWTLIFKRCSDCKGSVTERIVFLFFGRELMLVQNEPWTLNL